MSPPCSKIYCGDDYEAEYSATRSLSSAAAPPREEDNQHSADPSRRNQHPTLKRNPDGTFRRHFGRSPIGCRWDEQLGEYVPADHRKSKMDDTEDQEKKPAAVCSADKNRQNESSRTLQVASRKKNRTSPPPSMMVAVKEEGNPASPDPERSLDVGCSDGTILPRQAPRTNDYATSPPRPSGRQVKNRPPKQINHQSGPSPEDVAIAEIPRTSEVRSSQLHVGARVYAQWSENQYFWGYIVKVVDIGLQRRYYNVLFEDGDMQQGLKSGQILTETQFCNKHGSDPPPPITPAIHMLEKMHQFRCGGCSMCQQEGCGVCRSCIFNKSSTTIHRRMCILRMCQHLRNDSKALPSRCLPGWTFYCTATVAQLSSSVRFDPDVSALRLCSPKGKEFNRLETAMKHFGASNVYEAIKEFGEYELGVTVRRIRDDHKLIGKSYYHVWTDVRGRRIEIFGTIIQCLECLRNKERLFKVKYWDAYRIMINDAASIEAYIPEVDMLEEAPATGGCLAFLEKTKSSVRSSLFDFYCPTRFIVPVSTTDFRAGTFSILHDGIKLDFCRRPSKIPNAGEGLFVSATCLQQEGWMGSPDAFVLEPGVLLDLGIYAPLRKGDRKPFHVQEIKRFIFAHKPDIWVFDTKSYGHDALDITDDNTGHLHEQAEHNILVRVNETDGKKETPSVLAVHDPQGSVHYYLGNVEERLRIRFGREIELKIDYGPSYEQVRVRENYPRVRGTDLAQEKASLEALDLETLRDFFTYSANDVHEALLFFEAMLIPKRELSSLSRQRAMLAALSLYGRVRDIQDEFNIVPTPDLARICDNGYSTMEAINLAERSKTVVRAIARQITDKAQLKKKINRYYVLQEVLFKHVQVIPAMINPEQLWDKLCDLP